MPWTPVPYTLQTFGQSDAVLVLFTEEDNGDLRYVAGDDDSGSDRNAKLEQRLERGQPGLQRGHPARLGHGVAEPVLQLGLAARAAEGRDLGGVRPEVDGDQQRHGASCVTLRSSRGPRP